MPSITITTTAQQAQRLAAVIGRECGYKNADGTNRDATADEIKEFVIGTLRALVRDRERAPAPFTPFDPT